MKTCSSCGTEKPDDAFYAGRQCKTCKNARTMARRWANPDKARQIDHESYVRHREQRKAAKRADKAAQPTKHRARKILNAAIRAGTVRRGLVCEECGATDVSGADVRIEAHHPDYSRPLDVIWLCARHHAVLHRQSACA